MRRSSWQDKQEEIYDIYMTSQKIEGNKHTSEIPVEKKKEKLLRMRKNDGATKSPNTNRNLAITPRETSLYSVSTHVQPSFLPNIF